MSEITFESLQSFVDEWSEAGGAVVQHWTIWERLAAKFFETEVWQGRPEVMHQVMLIVIAVCEGTVDHVKRALREATPSALEVTKGLVSHIPHFSAVIDAEIRFRLGELAVDWSLEPDGSGRCVVRSEFKQPKLEH